MSDDPILEEIWRDRLRWSAAAGRQGDRIRRARIGALGCSVVGAALETSAATLFKDGGDTATVLAALGAIALAVATIIGRARLSSEAIRRWTKLRAVSEAIKGEVFRCRARAQPYDGSDRLEVLAARLTTIKQVEPAITGLLADVEPGAGTPPPELDPDAYIARRVRDQSQKYFRPKAALNARRAARLHGLVLLLSSLATVLGIVTSALAHFKVDALAIGAWVAVLTTVGSTLSSYLAASQLDHIVTSYTATAEQLDLLALRWHTAVDKGSAAWSRFVDEVEKLLAAENQSWLVKHLEVESGGAH